MISHLPSILLQASTVTDAVDIEEQVEKTLTATEKITGSSHGGWLRFS